MMLRGDRLRSGIPAALPDFERNRSGNLCRRSKIAQFKGPHYTIVLGNRGATQIADLIVEFVDRCQRS